MRLGPVLVILGAAAAYVIGDRVGDGAVPAFDVYGYFYPHMLYALRSLAAGHGLLWNPHQNCGQPFFAISSVGLLYPGNLFFLLFSPPLALRALLFANLLVGGLGFWALACELGLDVVAAVGGAIAFILSGTAIGLTLWMPTVQGPYVWIPWELFLCERLLRTGQLRDGLWLGVVFALALLPGHPQFALLGCELVGLRLLWALGSPTDRRHAGVAFGAVVVAVLLMVLLTAVQYLPAMEVVEASMRSRPLATAEILPTNAAMTWEALRFGILVNTANVPFSVVPGVIAVAALASPWRRRVALFYALAGALLLCLAFGDSTSLGRLYLSSPLGEAFRMPARFMYATGFCVSVLTGLAIEGLLRGRWAAAAAVAVALGAARFWLGGLSGTQWWLGGSMLAGGALAALLPTQRVVPRVLVVGALILAPIVVPVFTVQRYFSTDDPLWTGAEVFGDLRRRMTAQERVHLVSPTESDLGFQNKTAMLFGLNATTDYEGQLTRSYAEYITMLRTGQPLRSVNQVIYATPWNAATVRWPLMNLAAVRYAAIGPEVDVPAGAMRRQMTPIDSDPAVHLYENAAALPRAYYVPRVAVVADAAVRLLRLARGLDDPRQVALVEAALPSGFVGEPGDAAAAAAQFVVDDPEDVVLESDAPARGFLFLADQYFPGWIAFVNGLETPIVRANHTFRLVEVPAGPVRVEFHYRPASVRIGAAISLLTLAVVITALLATRSRPERPC